MDLKKTFKGIAISSGNSFVHETESQVILNTDFERMSFTKELLGIQNMWSDAPVDDNPNPSPFATKLQSNHDSSQFGESTG